MEKNGRLVSIYDESNFEIVKLEYTGKKLSWDKAKFTKKQFNNVPYECVALTSIQERLCMTPSLVRERTLKRGNAERTPPASGAGAQ